jgi:hypothetical protein
VPSPLGWTELRNNQDYVIDEHWDNTRTIYWRVRLDEFDEYTGNLDLTINQIDYTLTINDGETDPPVPNPMTFAIAPTAAGTGTITMTASTADDVSGVEYFFKCIAGPGHDSGWTTNPVYNDTGLIGNTQYTYTVTARDTSSNLNETDPSDPASATTYMSASDIFSVNFYAYGKGGATYWDQESWRETVTLREGGKDPAVGVGDWNTAGWVDFAVPWAPASPLNPVTLISTEGSTATFTFNDCRNGAPYHWTTMRTTLLGDANADMMDGHVNATDDPYDGSNIFDMDVSDITLGVYDVIVYLGANEGQYGAGAGKIVFNGGPEQGFQLPPKGEFSGFTEIVDSTTPGNYIVFKGVTGTSFTVQVWGNGADHIGPCGFQFGVLDTAAATVNAGSDWITWSGEPVTLNDVSVTNNDPGAGGLTLEWSAVPDTGVVFEPNEFVEEPTVTITKETDNPSAVTLTLTVTQAGKEPVESSMTIDVYDDGCQAALGAGETTIRPGDFNANCIMGLEDLAQMVAEWLVDFSLTEPVDK